MPIVFSASILFICTLVAFALSSISGGGAGLLLLPILGSLLPATQVPAALSVGTFSSSFSRIIVFHRYIRWQMVSWFVPAALPAVWLGAYLLKFINPIYLELAMGVFLVANLPQLFRAPVKAEANFSKSVMHPRVLLLIGFLAGFVSGVTGAVGLLFNRFYLRYGLNKEQIIATRAANEVLLHLVKLVLYTLFGLLTGRALGFGLIVALGAIVSSWGIQKVLSFLSETFFRKIGYGAMVLSGVALLWTSGSRIITQDRASVSLTPVSDGMEAKLQWRASAFALEYEYDEGFEFEQQVSLMDLPADKRQQAVDFAKDSEKEIIVEEVFGFQTHYYEIYKIRDGKVEKKEIA